MVRNTGSIFNPERHFADRLRRVGNNPLTLSGWFGGIVDLSPGRTACKTVGPIGIGLLFPLLGPFSTAGWRLDILYFVALIAVNLAV
jgi:hypothetical protein